MPIRKVILIILFQIFSLTLWAENYLSQVHKYQRFFVGTAEMSFPLDHEFIIKGSEKVFNDTTEFTAGRDYLFEPENGRIFFTVPLGNVTLSYSIYPDDLSRRFFLYRIQEYSDSTEVKLPPGRKRTFLSDTKLNISGSKSIAVSFASDEDFSLDQSLFLKISGELSRNLNIEAQLSDSKSPITPEGDSREISSLDQVFLRLYGNKYEVAFGDLEMDFKARNFLDYDPRFEGLKAGYYSRNLIQGAVAISKGKYRSVRLDGIEAKQGPYYLTSDQESGIQVVPGSETIYLNGQLQKRGSDYSIDYSEGSITFTSSSFISANSVILARFEYSSEDFRQNMYLAETGLEIFESLQWENAFIYQQDDKDNPLQTDYNPEDIEILEQAGDSLAWGSGAVETEPGQGNYIYNETGDYYEYVGFDSTGNFLVFFSFIGQGEGDYQEQTDDQGNIYYEYLGFNLGSYLPVRILAKPESKWNWDSSLTYSLSSLKLKAEGILTDLDQNTYSDLDDGDNTAKAYFLEAVFEPDYDRLRPVVSLSYRQLDQELATFSDLESAQDNYEIEPLETGRESREYNASLGLNYEDKVYTGGIYKLTDETGSESDYLSLQLQTGNIRYLPDINYRYLDWSNREDDNGSSGSSTDINQHDLNTEYGIGRFMVLGEYYNRIREDNFAEIRSGEKTNRIKLGIKTRKIKGFLAEISYQTESTDSLGSDMKWREDNTSDTYELLTEIIYRENSLRIRGSHREVSSNTNTNYDMIEIATVTTFWQDLINLYGNYSLQNVEFYPKLREFQFVGEDLGSYDEDSLFVGYGEGDYEWLVTDIDYDNPQLSIEVNAGITLSIDPSAITEGYLRNLRTDTEILISENSSSSEKFKVYLLDPDFLMQDDTTLYGRRFIRQTLWWDLMPRKLLARISGLQEWTKDSRYNEITEESRIEDYESSLQYTAARTMKFELSYRNRRETESRYDSSIDLDAIALETRIDLSSDLNLNSSLELSRETGESSDPGDDYKLGSLESSLILIYYYRSRYRIFSKFSYRHNDRRGSNFLSFLADKKAGSIFKWNLDIDYRINSYTSAVLEYEGNKYPRRKEEHELSLELKAEF